MKILIRRKDDTYGDVDNLRAIEPPLFMAIRAKEIGAKIVDEEIGDKLPLLCENDEIEEYNVGYLKILTTLPEFNINTPIDWDLLDLNKYKANNSLGWSGLPRSPYAVMFTSLGCPYKCDFCSVSKYYSKKYFLKDIEVIIEELKVLYKKGVRNIRFLDEIIFFNSERVEEICHKIIKNKLIGLNMFAYTRIDTIDTTNLNLFRKAGFRWLGFGIESGNKTIRDKYGNKNMTNEEIIYLVNKLKKADIGILGNYIFGFPDDDFNTMGETFKLAVELNFEYSNMYCLMAYPDTPIYQLALKEGWEIPKSKQQYSQYSYECFPLRTRYLTSKEVLKFRDDAFYAYHSNPVYLSWMREKFGQLAIDDIKQMLSVKIKRKLYV